MTTREPTPDILGNIMSGAPAAGPAPTSTTRRVHDLRPHPLNETIYGDRADADLIESVRSKGVLNPVLITVDNLIVSGHRRWGAAIAAGLTEVPVVVFGSSEALDVEEALIESNRQRQKTNEQIGREFKQLKAIINQRQSRQGQRSDLTSVSIDTEVAPPSERAAAELGVSRMTAHRIETVVNQIDTLQAAGQSEEAAELRQTLNRSVNAAHQQVRPAPAMLAVWELEATVRGVYTQVYGGNPEPYATRDMRTGAQMRAGRFWLLCTQSLPANQFRVSDLVQAINNFAAQVEAKRNGTNAMRNPTPGDPEYVPPALRPSPPPASYTVPEAVVDKPLPIWVTGDDVEETEVEEQPEPVAASTAMPDEIEPAADQSPISNLPVSQRSDYESDEWYTPAEYIDAAKAVMGAIDLDPASSEMAQTVVRAGVYLTRFDDGLAQVRWLHQRIWLNPPYSNPGPWIEKLVREHQAGPFCTEAIVLCNNATETSWFQLLLERFPVCLPARRLAFWRHDHANVGARQGQAFFYLGPNDDRFEEVFRQFGPILRRVA